MRCSGCGNNYDESDFFGKEKCYKCIYNEKVSIKDKKEKCNYCKICKKKVPKGRWIFCSEECSEIEHKEPWYYKINIYKISWENYSRWHS